MDSAGNVPENEFSTGLELVNEWEQVENTRLSRSPQAVWLVNVGELGTDKAHRLPHPKPRGSRLPLAYRPSKSLRK